MTESGQSKTMHRGFVVVGAILIQLCLGAIYAWSVFTPALNATTAEQIAAVYGPRQLGVSDADMPAYTEGLSALQTQMADVEGQIGAATDEAELNALAAERNRIEDDMTRLKLGFSSPDRIRELTYGFTRAQAQGIFAAGLASFAVVMVLAGRMMPRVGPRALAIAGGLVLGIGYLLGGLVAGKSFPMMLVCIGFIGGAGIGLGYVVPIAVGMKWFPDRKGLITGLAVAGFGFGALLWVKLGGDWGNLIATFGLPTTFMIYGIAFAALVLVGSIWMRFPPAGWLPAGYTLPQASAGGPPVAGATDFNTGQMLRTAQFYMILLTFAFGASAGLMSIGLMKSFPTEAMVARGIPLVRADAIAGTAMAVFFALANGLGRIGWGIFSDKIGRKTSIVLMMASQGVVVILFQWMAGVPALLYLGATLVGFNFGGNFALFPTITADTFGTKYIGQNYGWVFLAYGIGGIFGPILGGKLGDTGQFPLAFTICGVLCLLAAGIISAVRHPKPMTAAVAA